MKLSNCLISGFLFLQVLQPQKSFAHPHVFAQARLELKATSDGYIDELRHVWRFDEFFTSTVILEFDADTDGSLSGAELDEVANTVASSIADFNYFQNIEVGGEDVMLKKVTEMEITVEDNQLLIVFATVPFLPVALADSPKIGVFDPTFYTAIEFYDETDMIMVGGPQNCSHRMVVPDPDEAIAQNEQSLTEAFYNEPEGNDLSKIFATRMEVSCT